MTVRRKLPPDAFTLYVRLGPKRSYEAVAAAYEVSKRTVTEWASQENWQKRLQAIEGLAQANAEAGVAGALAEARERHLRRQAEMHEAFEEVATPQRMKAVAAALIKEAVERRDVAAARLVFDRVYGKPRSEALHGAALDLPRELQTAADVKVATNALLRAVAEGLMSPEDAQKASAVIEAARKAVETQDLEARITELEARERRDR